MSILNNFSIFIKTRIEFGFGVSNNIGNEIKAIGFKSVFIVTDRNLIKLMIVDKILKSLENQKICFTIFDEVEPNPHDKTVYKGVGLFNNHKHDLILAIGGGSVIDVSKAISILASHGGEIYDYRVDRIPNSSQNYKEITNKVIPLIAITTTAGSGSEASPWCVITDTIRHYKLAIFSPYIYPSLTLVDPDLMYSISPDVTAEGGMDALSHAIESYISTKSNSFSEAYAIQAIKMIGENLVKAVRDGGNKFARANMANASIMAGLAATLGDCHAVHNIAEAIGGMYDTSHGLLCGRLLPIVMDYDFSFIQSRLSDIALAFGLYPNSEISNEEFALLAIKKVNTLIEDSNLKKINDVIKIKPDFDKIVEMSCIYLSTSSSPRSMTKDDYLILVKRLFNHNY